MERSTDQAFVKLSLDHDDFGLNRSKIMNVIDSKSLEQDAGGTAVASAVFSRLTGFRVAPTLTL
jgi:hypothetical protein